MIAQNRPDSDYRIVTSKRTEDGRPIIANLKVDGRISSGDAARIVMTVYGWQDYARAMKGAKNSGAIRYVKDDDTARRLGLEGEAPLEIGKASVRSGVERTILTRATSLKRREQHHRRRRCPKFCYLSRRSDVIYTTDIRLVPGQAPSRWGMQRGI